MNKSHSSICRHALGFQRTETQQLMHMELIKKFFTMFLLTASSLAWSATENRSPTRVFLLGSGTPQSPWTVAIEQGLNTTLTQSDLPIIYYSDHLDAGRFNERKQYEVMYQYLQNKYAQQQPDIFIAAGPAASDFSRMYPDLFPGSTPILIQPNSDNYHDNAVIISPKLNYTSMVEEALRLSSPNQIYLIGDSIDSSDLHRMENLSKEIEAESRSYIPLVNLDLSSLLKAISQVPTDSTIFFTPIYREHEGKSLYPIQVLKRLHQVAKAPIFATSVTAIGSGTVGGHLYSPNELGIMAAEAVIDIVSNQPIDYSVDGFELVYDWNEIVRWNYRDKISLNSEIRFMPHSIWHEHQKETILIAAFLATLIALLVALTIYNRKLASVKFALFQERELLEQKVAERTQELSDLYKQAEKRARVDELTGISNRREFFELGELIHNQTTRTLIPYTIVMIDIDSFKHVNDSYGHAVGDKVIQSITTSITSVTRKSDVVARIGGEEFALILTNTPYDQVENLTERIRSTVENNHVESKKALISTTVSIGVAEYQLQDSHIGVVLARADKALYKAKESGKNRVVFW